MNRVYSTINFHIRIHYCYIIIIMNLVSSEEAMLERALAMSMEPEAGPSGLQSEIRTSTSASASTSAAASSYPDFDAMTEEEQIEFAMRMSMQENTTREFHIVLLEKINKMNIKNSPVCIFYHDRLELKFEEAPSVISEIISSLE